MKLFGYKITIEKVVKKNRPNGLRYKEWTKADINLLIELHKNDESVKGIAKHLNRTVPAVYARLYKIKKDKK